ncbi:hypothetical protein AFLA_001245 [Aspergillus flavus NRRL3357]|nr:hypothetical protein AFLA_001245 [Aspergillus flavus NRRL3357]
MTAPVVTHNVVYLILNARLTGSPQNDAKPNTSHAQFRWDSIVPACVSVCSVMYGYRPCVSATRKSNQPGIGR